MKRDVKKIGIAMALGMVLLSVGCKEKDKGETSLRSAPETIESLSEKAKKEQERKTREEAAKIDEEAKKEREIKQLKEKLPKPVTDIFFLYNSKDVPRGYTVAWKDLNKGAGGDDIFLCYSKDANKGKPITSLQVSFGGVVPKGYENVDCNSEKPCDLNNAAGGEDIFLYVGRNPSEGNPITDLDILIGEPRAKSGWNLIQKDLNARAGGEDIWLTYYR